MPERYGPSEPTDCFSTNEFQGTLQCPFSRSTTARIVDHVRFECDVSFGGHARRWPIWRTLCKPHPPDPAEILAIRVARLDRLWSLDRARSPANTQFRYRSSLLARPPLVRPPQVLRLARGNSGICKAARGARTIADDTGKGAHFKGTGVRGGVETPARSHRIPPGTIEVADNNLIQATFTWTIRDYRHGFVSPATELDGEASAIRSGWQHSCTHQSVVHQRRLRPRWLWIDN
jgi:hypothetical protein